MSPNMRRLASFGAGVLIVVIASLVFGRPGGSADETPIPTAVASVSASPSASPSPSTSPSIEPSPSASVAPTASPTATPTPSPSAAPVACAVKPQTGLLASDRVVSVEVSTSPTVDFVTFVFDDGSPSPAGPPRAT